MKIVKTEVDIVMENYIYLLSCFGCDRDAAVSFLCGVLNGFLKKLREHNVDLNYFIEHEELWEVFVDETYKDI